MKIEELNLASLKYFLDTVDTGSLTRSAEMNFVTRPAVSQAIQRLEQWCGKRLTTHEKKNFALTDDGREFYRHMKASYDVLRKSVEVGSLVSRSLKIGSSVSLTDHFLLPALKKVRLLNSARIRVATAANLRAMLEERSISLALFIGEADSTSFETKVVRSGRFVLASKTGDFRPTLITTESRAEVSELKRVLIKKKIAYENVLTAESWTLCVELALMLGGMVLIPDFLLKPPLKAISLSGLKLDYTISLGHLSFEHLSETEIELVGSIGG